jgi:hypothetical protein
LFATNNGTDTNTRARLMSDGTWRVNQLQALTTNGNLQILNNGTGIVQLPAGSTVGVFHQEWENLELKPNFFYKKNPAPPIHATYKAKPTSCPFSLGLYHDLN